MPGKDLSQPGRRSLDITGRLNEHGGYIDLKRLYEQGTNARKDRAEWSSILVDAGSSDVVYVNMCLWDDGDNNVVWPMNQRQVYPGRPGRIYLSGTTANLKIILIGQ